MSEKQELLKYERKILNILKEKVENIPIERWKYNPKYKSVNTRPNPTDFDEYLYLDGNDKIRIYTDEKTISTSQFKVKNYVEVYKNKKLLYRFEEEDEDKSLYKILEDKRKSMIAKIDKEKERKEIAKTNANRKKEERENIEKLKGLESILGQTTF